MAGHSQFKNIMHRKGRQDAQRAKAFAKLSREITIAGKMGGTDPAMNPRLRLAIRNAKAESMPKDNIDRAIKKAAGGDVENYDEIRYEGYGVGGVAVIVEALTDNRNRTGGNVRSLLSKHGGALGETNAVAYNFRRVGVIVYPASAGTTDDMLEAAIEAGADDCISDAERHTIICEFEALVDVSKILEAKLGEALSTKIEWHPQNTIAVDEEKLTTLMKMIAALEDDDDVQNVFANFEVSEDVIAKMSA